MELRILLIAMDERERKIYAESISALEVHVVPVPSIEGLDPKVKNLYYNGVVIDMPTKIYALKTNREFLYTTLRKFPTAHVSLEKENGQIKVFYPGQETGATLLDFITGKCRPFPPRKLSYHIRKESHFNVVLSRKRDSAIENSERTSTVDVSEKGCFLFSVQNWSPGDEVWLTFMELSDRTPIGAEICRCVKWGTPMQIPGIGVKFNAITETQSKEISKILWS